MKRFALLLLLCSSAWGAWPVGYTTFFTVTVNAAQVPSTQASFPMYFAGNAALLRAACRHFHKPQVQAATM